MCGILGISHQKDPVSLELYEGLLMLQHRGQDAAGITTLDDKHFYTQKNKGLVQEIFDQKDLELLKGTMGIGQVRYPTAGTLSVEESQPFFVNAPFGISLVHNGNLTNADELRHKLQKTYHRHLSTESDSEILLNILADEIYRSFKNDATEDIQETIFSAVERTMKQLKGAYSVVAIIDQVGMIAFRDPYGIRPLSIGIKDNLLGPEWAIASENVAFGHLGYQHLQDIRGGEVIFIDRKNQKFERQCIEPSLSPCIFEYIYLARPDSILDEISVYKTQLRLGQSLAKQIKQAKLQIDTIMPVPDSARHAALEISNHISVKYREGLVKNRYIGRTFIMPYQSVRRNAVRRKLNPIPLEFRNRNVLLVDDSIVRGTTMKQIVDICRKAGAKKVYIAICSPPVRYPNVYGVDMPNREEFIAHNLEIPQIQEALGCDALFYQTIPDMLAATRAGNEKIQTFEASCFDGKYVTPEVTPEFLKNLEENGRGQNKKLDISLF